MLRSSLVLRSSHKLLRLPPSTGALRSFSTQHFKASNTVHPLLPQNQYLAMEREMADKTGRQQNHIWNEAEISERMATADQKHVPQGLAELVLQKMVRVSYHAFNAITGYEHADPATSAIGYRCEDGRPAVYARPLV